MKGKMLHRWLFYVSYVVFIVLFVINALFFRSVYVFAYSCLLLLPSVFYIYDEHRANKKAAALLALIENNGIDGQANVLSIASTGVWSDAGMPYYNAQLVLCQSGMPLKIQEFAVPGDMVYPVDQLKSAPVRYLPGTGDAIILFDRLGKNHFHGAIAS